LKSRTLKLDHKQAQTKGIVKLLSSPAHSHVVPNLYEFLSSVEHIKEILKNVGNQTVDGSQKKYYASQWLQLNCLVSNLGDDRSLTIPLHCKPG